MKVLPGDVVSYKDANGAIKFLNVNTTVDDKIVGKQLLVTAHEEATYGSVVTINKSQVVAIR